MQIFQNLNLPKKGLNENIKIINIGIFFKFNLTFRNEQIF